MLACSNGRLSNFFDFNFLDGSEEKTSFGSTNIQETEDGYIFEIELPGFSSKEIELTYKDKYLILNAKRNEDKQISKNNYVVREIRNGSVSRKFYVPGINPDTLSTELNSGILKINAKKNQSNVKIIEIK